MTPLTRLCGIVFLAVVWFYPHFARAQFDGVDALAPANAMGEEERKLLAHTRPQILAEFVPVHIRKMFRDLSKEESDARDAEVMALDVFDARDDSRIWIKRLIDSNWAPADLSTLKCLKGAGTEADITRLRWEKDELRFDICQTRTIVTLKVTPMTNSGTGANKLDRVQFAKDLCQKVFVDSCRVYKGMTPTTVNGLRKILLTASFDPSQILELPGDKVVVGRPVHRKDVPFEETEYWYRRLLWWNDGTSVGFFFPKRDGPSTTEINLNGRYDRNWFDVGKPLTRAPRIVSEVVPVNIRSLFETPAADVEPGMLIEEQDSFRVAGAESWSWIMRTIDRQQLPKSKAGMRAFVANGDAKDCTRITWISNDFQFYVCQTRSIFVMKVSPIHGGTGIARDRRIQVVKDVCEKVFCDTAINPSPEDEGEPVKVSDIPQKICTASFTWAQIPDLPGDEVVTGQPSFDAFYFAGAISEFEYWYRRVSWWNDGESVGLYFPKTQGPGAIRVGLEGVLDGKWLQ